MQITNMEVWWAFIDYWLNINSHRHREHTTNHPHPQQAAACLAHPSGRDSDSTNSLKNLNFHRRPGDPGEHVNWAMKNMKHFSSVFYSQNPNVPQIGDDLPLIFILILFLIFILTSLSFSSARPRWCSEIIGSLRCTDMIWMFVVRLTIISRLPDRP